MKNNNLATHKLAVSEPSEVRTDASSRKSDGFASDPTDDNDGGDKEQEQLRGHGGRSVQARVTLDD